MKKVILCPNPYRDKGFAGTKAALELLKGTGLKTVVCLPFSDDGRFRDPELNMLPLQHELRDSDMVLAFGGDRDHPAFGESGRTAGDSHVGRQLGQPGVHLRTGTK